MVETTGDMITLHGKSIGGERVKRDVEDCK
jgi:hypothetical protein